MQVDADPEHIQPSGRPVSTFNLGPQEFTVFATDAAGNQSSVTHTYTVVPGPPRIFVTTPVEGATYVQGQEVIASYACSEGPFSPAVSCAGPVADGAPIDTSTPGPKTFEVDATGSGGLTASTTVSYTVTGAGPPAGRDDHRRAERAVRVTGDPRLADGAHVLDVRATSPSGLVGTAQKAFEVRPRCFPNLRIRSLPLCLLRRYDDRASRRVGRGAGRTGSGCRAREPRRPHLPDRPHDRSVQARRVNRCRQPLSPPPRYTGSEALMRR